MLLPLLDHEPVLLALGLSPVDELVAGRESDEPEIRGRLLRLKEEGGPWEELDVPDGRWVLGSGAKVARFILGGVLSPSTSASDAFLFADPVECDFWMGGGRLAFCSTNEEGSVGCDL